MAKSITVLCKITAADAATDFKSNFPASGSAGAARDADDVFQNEGIVTVGPVSGVQWVAVPWGSVSQPAAFGFRKLSGDGDVEVGLVYNSIFLKFARLKLAGEAGGFPTPAAFGSPFLAFRHLGTGDATVEFWVG